MPNAKHRPIRVTGRVFCEQCDVARVGRGSLFGVLPANARSCDLEGFSYPGMERAPYSPRTCARYALEKVDDLHARFRAMGELAIGPRFNVAPRQLMPVVLEDGERRLDVFQWGLVP